METKSALDSDEEAVEESDGIICRQSTRSLETGITEKDFSSRRGWPTVTMYRWHSQFKTTPR